MHSQIACAGLRIHGTFAGKARCSLFSSSCYRSLSSGIRSSRVAVSRGSTHCGTPIARFPLRPSASSSIAFTITSRNCLSIFFSIQLFFVHFKKHPRLRLTAATFAAVGFGNMVFHFTRDYWMIPRFGLVNAIVNFQVFAFYCIALAAAISVSQIRKRKVSHTDFLRGRVLPGAWVLFFYCVLDVFGETERNYSLVEHFRYLGHMRSVASIFRGNVWITAQQSVSVSNAFWSRGATRRVSATAILCFSVAGCSPSTRSKSCFSRKKSGALTSQRSVST